MTRVALPYCRVLASPPAARSTVTAHGNELVDIINQNHKQTHSAVQNLVFWPQPTLACYTPQYFYKAYHSVLAGGNAADFAFPLNFIPDPDLSASSRGTVTWKQMSGNVQAYASVPDGVFVSEIKVMQGFAATGSFWSFQTTSLGTHGWDRGYGTKKPGQTPKNGGVAITIQRGKNDTPVDSAPPDPPSTPLTLLSTSTPAEVAAQTAAYLAASQAQKGVANNQLVTADVRIAVGGIWSVKLPADGSAPTFDKMIGRAANFGLIWETLHTFTDVQSQAKTDAGDEYLVTFAAIAGRLIIGVNTSNLEGEGYCYTENDPQGNQKILHLDAAPVTITGVATGAPIQFGIRHLAWYTLGQYIGQLGLTDSAIGASGSWQIASPSLLSAFGYVAPGSLGFVMEVIQPQPTLAYYRCTVTSSLDNREPCALKWVKFTTPRLTTPGTGSPVDYGPAVTKYKEHQPEPDFSGAGNNRGSDAYCNVTFDIYGLNLIDAANTALGNPTNWRTALAKYSPVSFVMGNYICDENNPTAGVTIEEYTRIQGYVDVPELETAGFQDSRLTLTIRDRFMRLKAPAGFIKPGQYTLLETLHPNTPGYIYGWEAVKYILGKAIDQAAASSLRVFLGKDWLPLFNLQQQLIVTGQLPAQDTPLGLPPYCKFASEWLTDIARRDFCALYPAGDIWVYGQYQEIIRNLPTVQVYDGTDSAGVPISGAMSDTQLRFAISKADSKINTHDDWNSVYIAGRPPGNGGTDNTKFGAPLAPAISTDFPDVYNTWERTVFIDGDVGLWQKESNQQLADHVRIVSGKGVAAMKYSLALSLSVPQLFWGYKVTINGARDIALNGKTLRIIGVETDGNMVKKKATMTLSCVEVIPLL